MKLRILFLLAFVLFAVIPLKSQTFRGAINGTVTDPSGGVIAGATVKATEVATNIDHSTVTSNDGQFAFQDIPLGFYKVTVTVTGFPETTVDKVEVTAGSVYTLNVKLKMAKNVTTVEISAASLALDTTTTTQSMDIPDVVVQNLPLNGRDFTQMIAVQPGFGGYKRFKLQLRADMFNLFNRINFASGVGSVNVGGTFSPNYTSCAEDFTLHHCTSASGFGQVNDTIGDFNGAPGLGPGEQFNMQLAIKLIF